MMTLVRTMCSPRVFPDSPLVSSPPPSTDFLLLFFLVAMKKSVVLFSLPLSAICQAGEFIFPGCFSVLGHQFAGCTVSRHV